MAASDRVVQQRGGFAVAGLIGQAHRSDCLYGGQLAVVAGRELPGGIEMRFAFAATSGLDMQKSQFTVGDAHGVLVGHRLGDDEPAAQRRFGVRQTGPQPQESGTEGDERPTEHRRVIGGLGVGDSGPKTHGRRIDRASCDRRPTGVDLCMHARRARRRNAAATLASRIDQRLGWVDSKFSPEQTACPLQLLVGQRLVAAVGKATYQQRLVGLVKRAALDQPTGELHNVSAAAQRHRITGFVLERRLDPAGEPAACNQQPRIEAGTAVEVEPFEQFARRRTHGLPAAGLDL